MHEMTPRQQNELHRKMEELRIREADLRESFIRSSGPGGQNVNKTSTCVFLYHGPTKIFVKCQEGRSQAQNRLLARYWLVKKIEERQEKLKTIERSKIEKLRRQKRKRSFLAKQKMLEHKRRHAQKKSGRRKIDLREAGE